MSLTSLRYARGMIDVPPSDFGPDAIEQLLLAELGYSDRMLSTSFPILRHLLNSSDHAMFSDEIVARVRGQINDLARQIVIIVAQASDQNEPQAWAHEAAGDLAVHLAEDPALLSHCHALAMEWQLVLRLQSRTGIDPVLSPLVQALISGDDEALSPLAMNFLAAQVRFGQQQQRMELPVAELPAELLHRLLEVSVEHIATGNPALDAKVLRGFDEVRSQHDESAGRLGLAARMIAGIGAGGRAALAVSHAGVALFLTALAAFAGQERSAVVISTSECQLPRLLLALSASGLKAIEIEQQFATIHPEVTLPEGYDMLRPDRALALLASSNTQLAY